MSDKFEGEALIERQFSENLNPVLGDTPIITDIRDKHNTIIFIDSRRVRPLPDQPRHKTNPGFSAESIASLGQSISEQGQIEPALLALPKLEGWDADLVDGERRLRACRHQGLMLKARIDLTITDAEEHFIKSVTTNFHHVGHTTLEVMYAIERMRKTLTIKQIAVRFGKSVSWVGQHIFLMNLDESLHHLLVEPVIGQGAPEAVGDTRMRKGHVRQRAVLTLQVAMQIAHMPVEAQRAAGAEIVEEKLTHIEARKMVLKRAAELPTKGVLRTRSPAEMVKSLEGATNAALSRFGTFGDKRPAELLEIFRFMSQNDRKSLADDLRFLALTANDLGDLLVPKAKKV